MTTQTTARMAGPWRTLDTFNATLHNDGRVECVTELQAEDGELLCYANPDRALSIVQACNAHDALVAALQECVTADGAHCLAYGTDTPKLRARLAAINTLARAALAKAGAL